MATTDARPSLPSFTFDLSGGDLAFDFANTVGGHRALDPHEHLHDYPDLLAWSLQAGILSAEQAQALLEKALQRPAAALAAFDRALALREAIYRVGSAIAQRAQPDAADLETLSAEVRWAYSKARLVPADDGFSWAWAGDESALDRVLWDVARAAADLFTRGDLRTFRECAQTDCSWLFLDSSRNQRRQWCDMRTCGNRAKARRHYLRRKASRTVDASSA